ncbi:MAG: thymidine kinase [Lentimicrobiaceae bacterium]|jgi:thymidine kinase
MFLEKSTNNPSQGRGWIEVIVGSMFSGKTEELIRRLTRARIARQKVEIFKPEIDKRYDETNVVSHNDNSIRSIPVQNASQILLYIDGMDVVGIDEAQFLDDDLPAVCNYIANQGIRVIVAGLDMDFQGKPFGPIPALMATAEYVTKVHAICMRCGDLAHYSHRTVASEKLVLLGEKDNYEPLCRKCYRDSMTGFKD